MIHVNVHAVAADLAPGAIADTKHDRDGRSQVRIGTTAARDGGWCGAYLNAAECYELAQAWTDIGAQIAEREAAATNAPASIWQEVTG